MEALLKVKLKNVYKKFGWSLIPVLVILATFAVILAIFAMGSDVAPFVYTIF
jgi:uncharacterized membrane protein